jgi:hypothetical protein
MVSTVRFRVARQDAEAHFSPTLGMVGRVTAVVLPIRANLTEI